MHTQNKFCRSAVCVATVMLFTVCGFAAGNTITIEQVLTRLAQADNEASNFCSDVTFTAYDVNGKVVSGEKKGVRCYAKPDVSTVCVTSSTGSHERHGEVGRTILTEIDGKAVTQTIPDSFFLRDIRSIIAVHKGDVPFVGKTGETRFTFEPGGQTAIAENENGIYTIAIEAKGYERAVLRVNVKNGAVLEKTVFSIATGRQISRESHDDFIAAGQAILPRHTVYEYGGQKIIVHLQNYRINLPIDVSSFAAGKSACEELAAAFGRSLHSSGAQAPGTKALPSNISARQPR